MVAGTEAVLFVAGLLFATFLAVAVVSLLLGLLFIIVKFLYRQCTSTHTNCDRHENTIVNQGYEEPNVGEIPRRGRRSDDTNARKTHAYSTTIVGHSYEEPDTRVVAQRSCSLEPGENQKNLPVGGDTSDYEVIGKSVAKPGQERMTKSQGSSQGRKVPTPSSVAQIKAPTEAETTPSASGTTSTRDRSPGDLDSLVYTFYLAVTGSKAGEGAGKPGSEPKQERMSENQSSREGRKVPPPMEAYMELDLAGQEPAVYTELKK